MLSTGVQETLAKTARAAAREQCRGLSAGRSIQHMSVWLWMLGEDAAAETILDYSKYGKPQLRAICEKFGIDWTKFDDGEWRDSESDEGQPAPQSTVKLEWAT